MKLTNSNWNNRIFRIKKPIYNLTTNCGHFGKENLPWEKIIKL